MVCETVIGLSDGQYWLYVTVDPESNKLLHTTLEPIANKIVAHSFCAELFERYGASDAVLFMDISHSLKYVCRNPGLDFIHEHQENLISVERSF